MSHEEARATLLALGRPLPVVLRALRTELKLSDVALSGVVGPLALTYLQNQSCTPEYAEKRPFSFGTVADPCSTYEYEAQRRLFKRRPTRGKSL
jgi:hypothetical protein